ncbi:MAG: cobalamin-dependent protein, partial [Rhodospirillales bacterium]|nr:cobalamin-dependent protein [Rhodospirillales bacterium]
MRILLVITRQARMSTYQLPVGIGMISSCLKRAGHEVRVLNPNHSTLDLEMLVSGAIREFEPELLAIGGMSFHVSQIREAVDIARPLLPDQPIVLGGVCVSYQPEVAMRAIPGADYGVAGEGEYTIVELVQALEDGTDPGKVSGIIYRGEDGEYKQTLPRSFEKNLDELPWVDWEGVGLDVYAGVHKPGDGPPGLILDTSTRLMPFMASRGCPYKCTFCCHELSEGTYRSRSLDDCFAEIQYGMEEFGINALMIYDDVFCLKPARMHEFCERIQPLNLRWQVALRAEQVTADNLKMLEDAGCVTVGFGVE